MRTPNLGIEFPTMFSLPFSAIVHVFYRTCFRKVNMFYLGSVLLALCLPPLGVTLVEVATK